MAESEEMVERKRTRPGSRRSGSMAGCGETMSLGPAEAASVRLMPFVMSGPGREETRGQY
jgi:hypothetical protein